MAKYGMILTHVELKPEIDTANGEQVVQELSVVLQKKVEQTSKGLATLPGGDWSIIAHDITRLGNNLVVSFLLRSA